VAIEVSNRQRLVPIARRQVINVAAGALSAAGPRIEEGAEQVIVVAFVRDPVIRKLNSTYRGQDRETDVLSFPADPEYNPDSDVHLGDVVISTDTAVRQARRAGHSVTREINELVIHGVLHVCGYDHAADQGQMNRLELVLRRKLLDPPKRLMSPKNGY
jgi:probable rRNA maturation factor